MNKFWTIVIVIVIVVAAGWFFKYQWLPSQTVPTTSNGLVSTSDINQDLQSININDVDQQFQAIDNNLRGL